MVEEEAVWWKTEVILGWVLECAAGPARSSPSLSALRQEEGGRQDLLVGP